MNRALWFTAGYLAACGTVVTVAAFYLYAITNPPPPKMPPPWSSPRCLR